MMEVLSSKVAADTHLFDTNTQARLQSQTWRSLLLSQNHHRFNFQHQLKLNHLGSLTNSYRVSTLSLVWLLTASSLFLKLNWNNKIFSGKSYLDVFNRREKSVKGKIIWAPREMSSKYQDPPWQRSLQGRRDSLSRNKVLRDLQICRQGESLVDFFLVGDFPLVGFLAQLHHRRVVCACWNWKIFWAWRNIGVLGSSRTLLGFSIRADSWVFVNNACNKERRLLRDFSLQYKLHTKVNKYDGKVQRLKKCKEGARKDI